MSKRKAMFDRVKILLEKHPHLRDSDTRTVANILKQDYDKIKISEHYMALLQAIAEDKLPNPQDISRQWRLVQEQCKELRGAFYDVRHKIKVKKAQEEIKEIKQEENKFGTQPLLEYTNIGHDNS